MLLRLLHQQFATAVDASLSASGFDDIRAAHASVFTFVPPEGMTVSELTRRSHVRKQSMKQTVEELERLGYVERRDSPTDKRARLVVLTARGKKVRPLAMAAGQAIEARWAELLGPEPLLHLKQGLAELLLRLRPPDEAA